MNRRDALRSLAALPLVAAGAQTAPVVPHRVARIELWRTANIDTTMYRVSDTILVRGGNRSGLTNFHYADAARYLTAGGTQ